MRRRGRGGGPDHRKAAALSWPARAPWTADCRMARGDHFSTGAARHCCRWAPVPLPRALLSALQVDAGVANELVFGDPKAPRFVFWEGRLRPTPSGPDALTFDLMSLLGKARSCVWRAGGRGRALGATGVPTTAAAATEGGPGGPLPACPSELGRLLAPPPSPPPARTCAPLDPCGPGSGGPAERQHARVRRDCGAVHPAQPGRRGVLPPDRALLQVSGAGGAWRWR